MRGRMVVRLVALAVIVASPSLAGAGYWLNGRYYTKGVECDVTAGGLGNVLRSPETEALMCSIQPPPGDGRIVGLALCENHGGNDPPGLFPASVYAFGAMTTIDPARIAKNGKYFQPLYAVPTEQYAALAEACPNRNFVVVDFVPCAFTAVISIVDASVTPPATIAYETYDCAIDACLTLTFDEATGLPEKREYTCTKRP